MNIDVKAYIWTSVAEEAIQLTCRSIDCSKPATHTILAMISEIPGIGTATAQMALCNECLLKFLNATLAPAPTPTEEAK